MNQELLFWAIAAAITLLVVIIVLTGLRASNASGDRAAAMNRALLREEIDNLAKERDAGLISEAIYQQSVEDVQRRALEEIASAPAAHRKAHPAIVVVALAAAVAVGWGTYWRVGSPGLIPFVSDYQAGGIMQPDGSLAQSAHSYDVASLQAYLKRNPRDERAQTLLARLFVEQKDWVQAAQHYRAAVEIGGKVSRDVRVLGEYAASLMSQQTDETYAQAAQILDKALRIDETNANVRELAAIAALELERWQEACDHLELLLSRLSIDTPAYRSIAQTAAYAARMLQLKKERDAQPKIAPQ